MRLASVLSPDDWRLVAHAYDRIGGYNWRYDAGLLASDENQKRTVCEEIITATRDARPVLQRLM